MLVCTCICAQPAPGREETHIERGGGVGQCHATKSAPASVRVAPTAAAAAVRGISSRCGRTGPSLRRTVYAAGSRVALRRGFAALRNKKTRTLERHGAAEHALARHSRGAGACAVSRQMRPGGAAGRRPRGLLRPVRPPVLRPSPTQTRTHARG